MPQSVCQGHTATSSEAVVPDLGLWCHCMADGGAASCYMQDVFSTLFSGPRGPATCVGGMWLRLCLTISGHFGP